MNQQQANGTHTAFGKHTKFGPIREAHVPDMGTRLWNCMEWERNVGLVPSPSAGWAMGGARHAGGHGTGHARV